jgi:hypothetical protein
MYAKPVTIYKGIDNPIQVNVKNQDQKVVNMTGYAMQVEIQDPVNNVTVDSFSVTFANIALGRGTFTIDKNTVNSLEQRLYKLTMKTIRSDNNTEQPVYIDDNYGVPLYLNVQPGYYSSSPDSNGNGDNVIVDDLIDGGVLVPVSQSYTDPEVNGGVI